MWELLVQLVKRDLTERAQRVRLALVEIRAFRAQLGRPDLAEIRVLRAFKARLGKTVKMERMALECRVNVARQAQPGPARPFKAPPVQPGAPDQTELEQQGRRALLGHPPLDPLEPREPLRQARPGLLGPVQQGHQAHPLLEQQDQRGFLGHPLLDPLEPRELQDSQGRMGLEQPAQQALVSLDQRERRVRKGRMASSRTPCLSTALLGFFSAH